MFNRMYMQVDLAARERAVSEEEGRALADDFGAAFIEGVFYVCPMRRSII